MGQSVRSTAPCVRDGRHRKGPGRPAHATKSARCRPPFPVRASRAQGGSRARSCAPDRKLVLSPFRTPNPVSSVKIHHALTGSAVAIAAAVAGALGAWSAGSAAQPAATARPVGHVREVRPITPGPARPPDARTQPAQLDAFSATASKSVSSTADVTGIAARRRARVAPTSRQIGRRMLHNFHWGRRQFRYLDPLWARESSWNVHAFNASSGAYGIPQALPGSKMASAGRRWRTSARTQIRWGLRYIKSRYGSPAAAWRHEMATGWY